MKLVGFMVIQFAQTDLLGRKYSGMATRLSYNTTDGFPATHPGSIQAGAQVQRHSESLPAGLRILC
eukprot:16435572-Heterocapsa_arctica.AAC.1